MSSPTATSVRFTHLATFALAVAMVNGALASARTEPLRDDWVELDVRLISSLHPVMPLTFEPINDALNRLPPSSHRPTRRDLGFGVALHRQYYPGGYGGAEVAMVEVDGAVVGAQLWWHIGRRREYRRALRHALGTNAEWARGGLIHSVSDEQALARLREAPVRALGGVAPDATSRLRTEVEHLLDPFAPFVYTPLGCRDLKRLVRRRDMNAVRVVLRSPNLEARMLATDAMERLAELGMALSKEDEALIAALWSATVSVRVGSGCLVFDVPAWEARKWRSRT